MNRAKAARIPRIVAPMAAATLVLGLAALIAAHQSARTVTAGSAGRATGWVDRPAAIPAVSVPHNPGIAACTSGDLRVRMERRGLLGAGTYAYIYSAQNTAKRACYVSGRPGVKLAGQALAGGPNVLDVTAGALAPGSSATFAVTQRPRAGCTPAFSRSGVPRTSVVAAHIQIGARPPAATADGTIRTSRCSTTEVSQIGLAPTSPKPDQLSPLTIQLRAPERVRAGRTLDFTVTITNSTRAAIRLSPCPSYETGISSAPAVAYQLNCARPAIGAGQSRVYDMRFAVPASTPAGPAKIGWFLLNSTRTGAGGFITITK